MIENWLEGVREVREMEKRMSGGAGGEQTRGEWTPCMWSEAVYKQRL